MKVYVRIHHMKRTTIFVDEAIDQELHSLASRRGAPVSELVRDALGRYVAEESRGPGLRLRFLAAGRSGQKNISRRHEALLWRDLGPHGATTRRKRKG